MVEPSMFSVLIPLFALIVIELSQVARDINLVTAVSEERMPMKLMTYGGRLDPRWGRPTFGRFNILHLANTLILTYGIYLARYFANGDLEWLLALPLWIVLLLLPILEVNEYKDILRDENAITSIRMHMLLVVVYVSTFLLYGMLWVYTISVTGTHWVYLYQLDKEIPRGDGPDGQVQLTDF